MNTTTHHTGSVPQTDIAKPALVPSTYVLPAYWASYLINGDGSGLADGEQKQIDAWIARTSPGYCVDCGGQYFSWRNNATAIGGDVADFTFLSHE